MKYFYKIPVKKQLRSYLIIRGTIRIFFSGISFLLTLKPTQFRRNKHLIQYNLPAGEAISTLNYERTRRKMLLIQAASGRVRSDGRESLFFSTSTKAKYTIPQPLAVFASPPA
ncbi:MAG: hypothetical protein IT249_19015 [Chitinophagaceae bacterium]|nr:hypothetical protein [Chitinophagaceae bacterium]